MRKYDMVLEVELYGSAEGNRSYYEIIRRADRWSVRRTLLNKVNRVVDYSSKDMNVLLLRFEGYNGRRAIMTGNFSEVDGTRNLS